MKKEILFIVNPISGGKSKTGFRNLVETYLDSERFASKLIFTAYRGHAHEVAQKAVEEGCSVVVAVGGDGTVNEVASAIAGTNASMGIIPFGSGNGLALSLGIPLQVKAALSRLNNLRYSKIDVAELNQQKFFNLAGLGFDAHISHVFANSTKRGFNGYVKTAFLEFSSYKEQLYTIEIDGIIIERAAFMVCIANSSQFGNNAHVSPKASLTDGKLDVCIVKAFPIYWLLVMGYHMFSNTADRSRYVEIIQGRNIRIKRSAPGPVHLDGEPAIMDSDIYINVKPSSLSVIL